MHVLIIGGTGLISTAMVPQLLERGHQVTLYNRGVTQTRLPEPGRVRHLKGDRRDFAAFEAQMRDQRFDAVIDMVAFAPAEAESLLRAFSGRAKHLVVCSTVCVYGGPMTRLPATDDEPHRPVTEYGRNKSAIERTLLDASGVNGLYTTVLRPSFTTGEGHTLAGAVMFDDSTLDRMRKGRPVIVHDGGATAWAIAHVSDVARGFVGALLNERAFGQSYHLTSDEHTTWGAIYGAMNEAAGGSAPLVSIPTAWLAEVAPRRSVGLKFIYQYPSVFDNGKAARDLDFATTVPLVETFRRQIAWMDSDMDRGGKRLTVGEEPFQDALIDAFERKARPAPESFLDYNPWGDNTAI